MAKQITIQNSWLMYHMRFHCHLHDFKSYYFDRVLSKILQEIDPDPNTDIEIYFHDNFCNNAILLDSKKLKITLEKIFKSVIFYSENHYDQILDPINFTYRPSKLSGNHARNFKKMALELLNNKLHRDNTVPKKYFGLHILRPDTLRLSLVLELHRRNLLQYADVRLGINLDMLDVDEYRRSTNIDMVCWYYNISFNKLIEILSGLPKGSLDHFEYKKNNEKIMLKNDVDQCLLANNFLIDIVCDSKINDFVTSLSEKIIRPLITKNPYIFLGPRNSYIEFKKVYNIKTFDHIWNEKWDDFGAEFLKDKISGIADTCEYIVKNFSIQQLQEACKETVDYNFSVVVKNPFQNDTTPFETFISTANQQYPDFFAQTKN